MISKINYDSKVQQMDKLITWEMKIERRMWEPLPKQIEQLVKSFNVAVLMLNGVLYMGWEEVAFYNTLQHNKEQSQNTLLQLYLLSEKGTYPHISIWICLLIRLP